jgi:hypothetical protein
MYSFFLKLVFVCVAKLAYFCTYMKMLICNNIHVKRQHLELIFFINAIVSGLRSVAVRIFFAAGVSAVASITATADIPGVPVVPATDLFCRPSVGDVPASVGVPAGHGLPDLMAYLLLLEFLVMLAS